ncbi:MAG TPA: SCE4755 family polysaccharide monooxygenase-like protein [Kofleriaceae bacterium]
MRAALVLALGLIPVSASAHIHLTQPQARTDSTTGDQKEQHCGVLNQTRNPARVSTYKPGDMLTVNWLETINHTGWYRISFQPDGAVFGIPPAANGPTGGGAASNFPTENRTGMVDAANGSIVLADRIADGTLTTTVTLPMMECNNCTLQFIQVMNDKPPYTVDAASDDIYFNCADITLANNAPDAGMVNMPDAGNGGSGSGSNMGGGGEISGGCSTGPVTGLLGLLGLLGLRRRRR